MPPQPDPTSPARPTPDQAEALVRRRLGPNLSRMKAAALVLLLSALAFLFWNFYNHTAAALRFGLFSNVHWRFKSPPWRGGYTLVNLDNRYLLTDPGQPSRPGQPHELDSLTRLNRVEILDLANAYQLDDSHLAVIARLPHLRELDLGVHDDPRIPVPGASPRSSKPPAYDRSPRTDQVLAYIKPLRNLEVLNLARSQITDEGLESLAGLPRLTSLDLSHTPVTDACIPTLLSLPALDTLIIDGTQITRQGLDQLLEGHPNLFIDHHLLFDETGANLGITP